MSVGSSIFLLLILGLILPSTFLPWADSTVDADRLAASTWARLDTRPFTVVWNMPTAKCQEKYGVHLNLNVFDIVENRHEKFLGQNMTIFYYTKLGLYPYLSKDGYRINGGVPQQGDLKAHLEVAKPQIEHLLRPDFHGLAVIDWEMWRPLWVRNFGAKLKYRVLSKQLVEEDNPKLSSEQVKFMAREEFEQGAMQFMSGTLQLAADMRPKGLWGYYGFPDCYNSYHKGHQTSNYTGRCHPKTAERNDRLSWLWHRSSALYPSIYLPVRLAGSPDAALMVRHRVQEALRVASKHATSSRPVPVLPYARVAFIHSLRFLTKTDLEHTLGEAAALGASGAVLWGELMFAKSKRQCLALQGYLNNVLGHFISTLKRGTQHCSDRLCSGMGRCVRRDPTSTHYLHASHLPSAMRAEPSGNSTQNHAQLRSAFRCTCYRGWTGEQCQERVP